MTVAELKPYQDKTVVLNLKDGEIATVKVLFVDAEHEDIIVDIIATTVLMGTTVRRTPRIPFRLLP